jgi:TolA-binding protein
MITTTQNKLLHALLAQTNLVGQKANLVCSMTSGRTEKSSEMNSMEANELIAYLRTQTAALRTDGLEARADRMRKKILSLAWQMNWTNLNTKREVKVDVNRVNAWCSKYGYLKKPLNDYLYDELPKLLTQFESVYNSYLIDLRK